MTSFKSVAIGATAMVLICGVPSLAIAQATFGIANNDSIYVDGKTMKVVPGKAKGDASALIKELNAQDLGPGTLIFRSGDKLYIADAQPVEGVRFGSDRYGSDRYGSDRYGSDRYGSDRYGTDRYGSDRYGSDRYGSDRYGSDRYGRDRYGSERYGSHRYC